MAERIAIIEGLRTPFCKAGSAFKQQPADILGATIVKECLLRSECPPELVDEVIIGNVIQPSDALNIARVIALRAGLDESVPAYTVHRNCASGMEAFTTAMNKIMAKQASIIIAGGSESMSRVPLLFSEAMKDWFEQWMRAKTASAKVQQLLKFKLKNLAPIIALKEGLTDPVCNQIMGMTAENLAEEFYITRQEQDEYALKSHQRAISAQQENKFDEEILPIPIINGYKSIQTEDIGPRKDQSMETLTKLKPFFKRQTGTVTVGNSCGITDGAAAAILMKESQAKKLGLKPLGYMVDYAYAGLQPHRMGLGPVFATAKLLKKTKRKMADIDLIEMNEAFAAQILANVKAFDSKEFAKNELNQSTKVGEIDPEKLNVNGGAIALGHPVGTSGTRIIITLLNELKRQNKNTGIATLCVGGGQGGACLLETADS